MLRTNVLYKYNYWEIKYIILRCLYLSYEHMNASFLILMRWLLFCLLLFKFKEIATTCSALFLNSQENHSCEQAWDSRRQACGVTTAHVTRVTEFLHIVIVHVFVSIYSVLKLYCSSVVLMRLCLEILFIKLEKVYE